jgi:hypothetical protein
MLCTKIQLKYFEAQSATPRFKIQLKYFKVQNTELHAKIQLFKDNIYSKRRRTSMGALVKVFFFNKIIPNSHALLKK